MPKFLSILLLIALPHLANAEELSFRFIGALTGVIDDHGFLQGEFDSGNLIDGTLVYETNTPEDSTTVTDPTASIYAAVKQFRVSINGVVFEGSSHSLPGHLQIWDDRVVGPSVVDALTFSSPLDFTPPISGMGAGTVVGAVNLNLFDFSHSATQGGTIIPTSIDLSKYGSAVFSALQLNTDTNRAFFLNGTIASISPVPEPAALLLFALGMLVVLVRYGRRMNDRADG